MHSSLPRYLRYAFAFVTFVLFSLLFLDYRNLVPVGWYNTATWLQFGPSLIKFIRGFTIAAAGFAIVLLLTLILGRVYCSALCPLGILQDIVIRIKKWSSKNKLRFRFKKGSAWRWFIFAIACLSVISGYMLVYNLLDPYSNFGKIFSVLGKPLMILVNNAIGFAGDKTGWFIVNRYPLRGFDWATLAFPTALLILILSLSWKRGRLFCNLLCPVGALLGLISKYSFVTLRIEKSKCNQCGLCQAQCKAQCINIKTQEIDHSRCVMCFDCIGPCPDDGVELVLASRNKKRISAEAVNPDVSESKRKLLGTALLLGIASQLKAVTGKEEVFEKPTKIAEKKDCAVSPPGSVSADKFNSSCIACHLCVSACPTQVLQPSLLQYGLQGFLQPYMDYHANFCNFECVECTNVCPTGALKPLSVAEKKTLQLGKTTFLKENCVVYNYNTACGACSEHCPTKAVHMVPYGNGLTIPEVDQSICVGCGACEYACPTKPYKAIFVNGNPVHLKALPPKQEKLKRDTENEDWAF